MKKIISVRCHPDTPGAAIKVPAMATRFVPSAMANPPMSVCNLAVDLTTLSHLGKFLAFNMDWIFPGVALKPYKVRVFTSKDRMPSDFAQLFPPYSKEFGDGNAFIESLAKQIVNTGARLVGIVDSTMGDKRTAVYHAVHHWSLERAWPEKPLRFGSKDALVRYRNKLHWYEGCDEVTRSRFLCPVSNFEENSFQISHADYVFSDGSGVIYGEELQQQLMAILKSEKYEEWGY